MKTLRHTTALLAASTLLSLAACSSESSGTGGGGGSGGEGGAGATTSSTTGSTGTGTGGGDTTSVGGGSTSSAGGGTTTGTGGGEADFLPIWEGVAYPDDGGRVDIEAFEGVTLQVRVAGSDQVALELSDASLADGEILHVYAIGLLEDDSLDALVVVDGDAVEPAPGAQSLRFAHLVPDGPAIDLYLVSEAEELIGPLFGSEDFAFPAVSTYGELEAGTYDVLVVLPGGEPEEAIAAFEGLEVGDGGFVTVGAIGLLGDDSFGLITYEDDLAAPEAGSGAITFVHTAPDAPAVDVGALVAP